MKDEIKLSVIIPCYNVDKFLDNLFLCIDDVDLDSVEYIFINDGSNDRTKDKLTDYINKNNKCILINQNNKGAAASRNVGLENSKGKYVIFIDSDDFIKPDSLKLIINAMEKENADTLCIKSIHVKENALYTKQRLNNINYLKYTEKDLEYIYAEAMAMGDVYVGSPHMFFKKAIIMKIPSYPLIFSDIIGEDCKFNLICLKYSKTILISQNSYYFYRQRKDSLMHSNFNAKTISILSCNDILLQDDYNNDVKNHTLARNYLNSIYVLQKMIKSKYKDTNNIKYVYNIFKSNRKYLKKAKRISWATRVFTPLCTPYFYLVLKSKLK